MTLLGRPALTAEVWPADESIPTARNSWSASVAVTLFKRACGACPYCLLSRRGKRWMSAHSPNLGSAPGTAQLCSVGN